MTNKEHWDDRYQSGIRPWNTGRPDFILREFITQTSFITPCSVLELGCGLGINSIWLSQQGFIVTGIDISEIAILEARQNAQQEQANCTFLVRNFLMEPIYSHPFDWVFDRGCFHSIGTHEERCRFASLVAGHLVNQGLWLSIMASADDVKKESGPPRLSAAEIAAAVEPYFKIVLLESTTMDSNNKLPIKAWKCLLRKRQET
jgi:SAM-dependent methyltransferase